MLIILLAFFSFSTGQKGADETRGKVLDSVQNGVVPEAPPKENG